MKWISAIVLTLALIACNRGETTSETSDTSSTTATTATSAASDTTGTVVPMTTDTAMTSTTSTMSTSTSAPAMSGTMMSTGATGTTGATGMTGTTSTTTTHTENTLPVPESMASGAPDLVADGIAVYKAKSCGTCHGATGAGDTPMGQKNKIRDFHSADVQKQSDAELAKILTEGKGPVSKAAHKGKALTDLQVKSVIAWIRSLK